MTITSDVARAEVYVIVIDNFHSGTGVSPDCES